MQKYIEICKNMWKYVEIWKYVGIYRNMYDQKYGEIL